MQLSRKWCRLHKVFMEGSHCFRMGKQVALTYLTEKLEESCIALQRC